MMELRPSRSRSISGPTSYCSISDAGIDLYTKSRDDCAPGDRSRHRELLRSRVSGKKRIGKSREAGFDMHLVKPVAIDDLTQALGVGGSALH
jgi:hypothetical protein